MDENITSIKFNKYLLLFLVIVVFFLNINNCLALNLGDAFNDPLKKAAGTQGAGYNTEIKAEGVIGDILNIALSFLGVIFMVLMIYGGYIWMISRGNEQEVEKAKNIIIAAIIGLIIVISAYAVSWLIINQFGGTALK